VVSKRNPRIVYCSLSGYGQTGPYSNLVGHDINYISLGGALGAIGWPGVPPAIPLNLIADFAGGGLYAAFAIVTAIVAREKTGRGQYVDMAMSDGVTSLLAMATGQFFSAGHVPQRGADFLNGASETCQSLGCDEFIPHQNNREKFPEMFEWMRAKFKEKTRDEWFEELRQRDICVGPVLALDEVFEDPHVIAREMVIEIEHPQFGLVKQVGIGPKFSDTPGSVRTTGPARGEHTDAVLDEAGLSADEIAALREAGAAG